MMLFTDSTLLVRVLQPSQRPDISVAHTIQDIRATAASLAWCRILKVSRDEVAPAHALATVCRSSVLPVSWFSF